MFSIFLVALKRVRIEDWRVWSILSRLFLCIAMRQIFYCRHLLTLTSSRFCRLSTWRILKISDMFTREHFKRKFHFCWFLSIYRAMGEILRELWLYSLISFNAKISSWSAVVLWTMWKCTTVSTIPQPWSARTVVNSGTWCYTPRSLACTWRSSHWSAPRTPKTVDSRASLSSLRASSV